MSITFNIQQGGLGRRLPGEDYISGFAFAIADADLPSGFSTSVRTRKFESIEQAESAGITADAAAATVKALHFHVKEFFFQFERKRQSIGELWVHLYDAATSLVEGDILALQNSAEGKIRQMYVWTNEVFAASLVSVCGAAAATMLNQNTPAVIALGADFTGVTDLSTLTDIRSLDQQFVSVDFAQDGSAEADAIALELGTSLGAGGTLMGIMASANVALNIGWVQEFDVSDGIRFQTIKFANGDLFSQASTVDINSLETKGYIFIASIRGISGSFYNDSPQAVAADNDFAFVENSRTIQKAIREINFELLPFTNAPIFVDANTGFLSETTIYELETVVFRALNRMAADFELSVDQQTNRLPNNAVFIDPDQNVLATSLVNIIVRIVPVGVQRATTVNIGFVPKLNT